MSRRLQNKLADLKTTQTIRLFVESGCLRVRKKGEAELIDLTFNKLVSRDAQSLPESIGKDCGGL